MRPTLFHCPFGTRFVTSDQPVALFHPLAARIGVGPATPGVEISLPLSSRSLLLLDHLPGDPREVVASSADVEEFNRRTIIMARDYVFTGEGPESLMPAIDAWKGQAAGFEYEDIETDKEYVQVQRFVAVGPDESR